MLGWVMIPLQRYAEVSGRSSRAEFWKWTLSFYFLMLLLVVLIFAARYVSPTASTVLIVIAVIAFIAALMPNIAIQVRRLHDTNRSGYWLLASVVLNGIDRAAGFSQSGVALIVAGSASLIMSLVLLVVYCLPGTPGENDHGPSPYADTDLEALAEQFQ
jgi:uncharacterized membrane protein YhaH (DUF805 family)